MLSGNCTEALSIQANVTISCSSAKLIKKGIAPLPFPLPALLKQYWYIKRGERVRVRGHAQFYATLGSIRDAEILDQVRHVLRRQADFQPLRHQRLTGSPHPVDLRAQHHCLRAVRSTQSDA